MNQQDPHIYQQKAPSNNQPPPPPPPNPPQQPWWVGALNFLASLVNYLGELIISNRFISLIQTMFQEHIKAINHLLNYYESPEFWRDVSIYSAVLTSMLVLKGFFRYNILNLEITVGILIISVYMAKFHKSKGSLKVEIEEEIEYREPETQYEEEPLIENTEEPPQEEPPIEKEVVYQQKGELNAEEINTLKNITKMFSSALDKTEEERVDPGKSLIRDALKTDPELFNDMTYEKLSSSLSSRNNIKETTTPLEDIGQRAQKISNKHKTSKNYDTVIGIIDKNIIS